MSCITIDAKVPNCITIYVQKPDPITIYTNLQKDRYDKKKHKNKIDDYYRWVKDNETEEVPVFVPARCNFLIEFALPQHYTEFDSITFSGTQCTGIIISRNNPTYTRTSSNDYTFQLGFNQEVLYSIQPDGMGENDTYYNGGTAPTWTDAELQKYVDRERSRCEEANNNEEAYVMQLPIEYLIDELGFTIVYMKNLTLSWHQANGRLLNQTSEPDPIE